MDGLTLHSKVTGVDGACFKLAGGLEETLDAVDETCRNEIAGIDKFIAENRLGDPQEYVPSIEWLPPRESRLFNLAEANVSAVIYATGFHRDFSWIELPVFDETGYPRYHRGVTDLPGLYFCGLHWMHTQGSGLFYGVGDDAEYVVDHCISAGA